MTTGTPLWHNWQRSWQRSFGSLQTQDVGLRRGGVGGRFGFRRGLWSAGAALPLWLPAQPFPRPWPPVPSS